MIRKRLYFVLMIIAGSLALLSLVLFGVLLGLHLLPYWGDFLLALAFSGFLAFFFVCLVRYLTIQNQYHSLVNQNRYSFGVETGFYDRPIFESTVATLRKTKHHRKQKQTLIAFSGSTMNLMTNNNRRLAIIQFNAAITRYLTKRFEKESGKKCVFGYQGGIFYVYRFGDTRTEVLNLCNEIYDYLYRLVAEENLHLFVCPYFGLEEVKPEEPLIEAIQNAEIARSRSERNFEWLSFYAAEMRSAGTSDDAEELLHALENGEFVVYYQPKFNLKKNQFTSSEALIRWKSPTRGFMSPGAFIPKAEAVGLIHDLDVYVFNRVCQDLAETRKRGRRLLPVSMNFSLYEFYSPTFVDMILNTMKHYNVDPKYVEIEITETTSQSNPFLAISIIKKLKEQGMRVLMDDFGIGYSNIGNLSRIPFDTIKIDKTYVDDVITSEKARGVCQSLINIGRILGMEVIAEGADKEGQVSFLRQAGCDTIQGYYYSKPISKEEYDAFLIDNPFEKKDEEEDSAK